MFDFSFAGGRLSIYKIRSVIPYCREKRRQTKNINALALKKIHQRSWQIEKTILMLAKLTANQTKQAHPELDTSSLEEVVKELMKEKSVD